MKAICCCQYCNGGIEFNAEDAGKKTLCPHCGMETLVFVPNAQSSEVGLTPLHETQFQQQAETVFLKEMGVSVTNTRFIVGGRTFPISGITSVNPNILLPSRVGPVTLFVSGILLLLLYYIGIVVIIGSVIYWWKQKPAFDVTIRTAGSEIMAYQSADKQQIARIVVALNQAIAARG